MAVAVDNTIMEELLKEVEGYLPEMRTFLQTLRKDIGSDEGAEEFFRMTHTIKGAASMVKLSGLSKSAEIMEDVLYDIKSDRQEWDQRLVETMAETVQRFSVYCEFLHIGEGDGDALLQKTEAAFSRYHTSLAEVDEDSGDDEDEVDLSEDMLFADQEDESTEDLFRQLAEDDADDSGDELQSLFQELDADDADDQADEDDERLNLFNLIDEDEGEDLISDPDMDADAFLADALGEEDAVEDAVEDQADLSAIDPELLDIFNEEAEEHLENTGRKLNMLSSTVTAATPIAEQERGILHSIRRSVHTLKGAAAVIGIEQIAAWGHEFEDFLDWLHDDADQLSPDIITIMQESSDVLELLAENPAANVAAEINGIKTVFQAIMGGDATQEEISPVLTAIDPELLDIFNEEVEEHLENTGRQLNLLSSVTESAPIDDQKRKILHSLRRSIHTLKGAAAVIGIGSVAAWGHEFEDFLDWLHDDAAQMSPHTISAMLDGADIIEQLAGNPAVNVDSEINRAKAVFQTIMGGGSPDKDVATVSPAPEQPQPQPVAQPSPATGKPKTKVKTLRVGVDKIEKVIGLSGDMTINLSSYEDTMSLMRSNLTEFELTLQRLKGVASSLEAGYDLATIPHLGTGQDGQEDEMMDEFDPLEMDRYSELNILIRSLNEIVVDLDSINTQTTDIQDSWGRGVERQRRVLVDVQETMKSIQMTPFSTLSNRMYKTVRESARVTGKLVRLVIEGGTIEMDTHVWDLLADPLMHMLRNSVDHGVEDSEERIKAGKSDQATIRIDCSRRGSQFILRLSDDGRGLDYEAIRRRAVQLYSGIGVEEMSNSELASLIFRQGFSIKSEVTTMSGRGVGMDVVRNAVDRLNGFIEALPGGEQGVEFILTLPITVAQLPALLVNFGSEQFAVPMRDISRVFRMDSQEAGLDEFELDGEILPLLRPAEILRLPGAAALSVDDSDANLLVLSVDAAGRRGVLVTNGIIGKRDVVFKNLGSHLHQVPCVAGATIMGNGSLVPILQTEDLFDRELSVLHPGDTPDIIVEEKPLNILIVDDSISIRKVLGNFITANGWNPIVANDGVDALEKLRAKEPDLILLDIEMPRMNGFEVLQYLQSQSKYRAIPVLMLTSRSAGKYRDKASDLGASGFVTKPFNDEELLSLIFSLTR